MVGKSTNQWPHIYTPSQEVHHLWYLSFGGYSGWLPKILRVFILSNPYSCTPPLSLGECKEYFPQIFELCNNLQYIDINTANDIIKYGFEMVVHPAMFLTMTRFFFLSGIYCKALSTYAPTTNRVYIAWQRFDSQKSAGIRLGFLHLHILHCFQSRPCSSWV